MRVSPSASLKLPLTSTLAALPPTVTVCADIVPTAVGARFGCVAAFTVTEMVCVALALLGSVAVTVIVALPAATGVILTLEPETLAVALLTSEELAV